MTTNKKESQNGKELNKFVNKKNLEWVVDGKTEKSLPIGKCFQIDSETIQKLFENVQWLCGDL